DRFRIVLRASRNCIVYAFDIDSANRVTPLAVGITARAQELIDIPTPQNGGASWARADPTPGVERLYVYITMRPDRKLSALLNAHPIANTTGSKLAERFGTSNPQGRELVNEQTSETLSVTAVRDIPINGA